MRNKVTFIVTGFLKLGAVRSKVTFIVAVSSSSVPQEVISFKAENKNDERIFSSNSESFIFLHFCIPDSV